MDFLFFELHLLNLMEKASAKLLNP